MCGISGYFGRRQITSDVINGTLNLMKNRGPNFSNHYNKKFEVVQWLLYVPVD